MYLYFKSYTLPLLVILCLPDMKLNWKSPILMDTFLSSVKLKSLSQFFMSRARLFFFFLNVRSVLIYITNIIDCVRYG